VRYGTETIVWNFEADPTANGSRPRRQQKKQALLKPHENETAHAAGSAKSTRKSQPFPAAATAKHRRRRHGLLRQPRRGHCSASPGIRFSHEEAGKPAAAEEKVDYMNLPCPVPYEEVQRESFSKFPGASALV
jgi:hypothetical protein